MKSKSLHYCKHNWLLVSPNGWTKCSKCDARGHKDDVDHIQRESRRRYQHHAIFDKPMAPMKKELLPKILIKEVIQPLSEWARCPVCNPYNNESRSKK